MEKSEAQSSLLLLPDLEELAALLKTADEKLSAIHSFLERLSGPEIRTGRFGHINRNVPSAKEKNALYDSVGGREKFNAYMETYYGTISDLITQNLSGADDDIRHEHGDMEETRDESSSGDDEEDEEEEESPPSEAAAADE